MLAPTLKAHLSKEQAKWYPVNGSNMGSPSTLLSVRLESNAAQQLGRPNLPSLPLRYIVSCDAGDSIGIAHAHNAMMMEIAGRGPSSQSRLRREQTLQSFVKLGELVLSPLLPRVYLRAIALRFYVGESNISKSATAPEARITLHSSPTTFRLIQLPDP